MLDARDDTLQQTVEQTVSFVASPGADPQVRSYADSVYLAVQWVASADTFMGGAYRVALVAAVVALVVVLVTVLPFGK